jgi:hypothetical protein
LAVEIDLAFGGACGIMSPAMKRMIPMLKRRRAVIATVALTALAAVALAVSGCHGPAGESPKTSPPPGSSSAAEAAQRMASLVAINVTNGPVTAAAAAEWKQTLEKLAAQGPAAVPALREFLAKNLDLNFEPYGNDQRLGPASLRLGLLNALEKIGGAEATAAAQDIFKKTADPAELATLAKFLERAAPGKHRAEFVSAAKETLALATAGNWDGRDVAPLFEMLRTFGGPAEIAELERYANTWFDYTAITLARWPDGAGVPSLIQRAQNANGAITLGREMYQRMLAEVAVNFPAAADALVAQVRGNKIDVAAWPNLGHALAGDTLHLAKSYLNPPAPRVARAEPRAYHVALGNQNYLETALSDDAPANELGDRIRLIDRLLEATSHPPAVDALEGARIALSARLARAK